MSSSGSPGSPFGERKSYKKFERRMSSRYSRQESHQNSTTSMDGGTEDFRMMARRLSKGAQQSTALLDPAARLAAQKKLEADEKLRLQKEIEDVKNKMNNVETVEKSGFTYDPTKVKGQFEAEMKDVEDLVENAPKEESDDYKEWLEEIMSQGWNDEVKELVSGRKKVSKRNLIRARKRSIVRRYSIIVPEFTEQYALPSEEDEFTEQEKMRREVEKLIGKIDLTYTIGELSNDKQWMAEIQELVASKKKITIHNLGNARIRNIVKICQEKYPGCFYDLELEPDEFTEEELQRQQLDKDIATIRVIVEGCDEMDVIVDSLTKKWIFNLDGLDKEKKKRNKRNIFNLLVRQLVKDANDKFPNLNYNVELKDDEYTDEEQRRRDFEQAVKDIESEIESQSEEEFVGCYSEQVSHLKEKDMLTSKDNIIKQLKRDALLKIYGPYADEALLQSHGLSDDSFEFTDRGLALKFIASEMKIIDIKLEDSENMNTNFSIELAQLKSIKAQTHNDNVRLLCLIMTKQEALRKYPECGLDIPASNYQLTDEGKAYIDLLKKFTELNKALDTLDVEIFNKDPAWEEARSYLTDKNMKLSPRNIVTAKKLQLYEDYKRKFPDADYEEKFSFEDYTFGELAVMKEEKKAGRYKEICVKLNEELKNCKIGLDRSHKRTEIEGNTLAENLDQSEWREELKHMVLIEKPANRKNLFERKARNIVEDYKRRYGDFSFEEYSSVDHDYVDDEGVPEEELNSSTGGCLTCEIKAMTKFFQDNPDQLGSPDKYLPSFDQDLLEDQIIAIPYFSDTDTSGQSVPPSPCSAGQVFDPIIEDLSYETQDEVVTDAPSCHYNEDRAHLTADTETEEGEVGGDQNGYGCTTDDYGDDCSVVDRLRESVSTPVAKGTTSTNDEISSPVKDPDSDALVEADGSHKLVRRVSSDKQKTSDKTEAKPNSQEMESGATKPVRAVTVNSASEKQQKDEAKAASADVTKPESATHSEDGILTFEETPLYTSNSLTQLQDITKDEPQSTPTTRPEVLLSQGFDLENLEAGDDLESCTLPSALTTTPLDQMSSPFPSHGYISPHKTFESEDRRAEVESTSSLVNGTGHDSAYESRSSVRSEDNDLAQFIPDSTPPALAPGLGITLDDQIVESVETPDDLAGPEVHLPSTLKSESFGSDNVFINSTPSPQPPDLTGTESEMSEANVEEDEKEGRGYSGNDGDISEFSPADEGLLLNVTCGKNQLSLPGKTISEMRKVSSGSSDEESEEVKANRNQKRKRVSSSDVHPVMKRQEVYNKRTTILASKKTNNNTRNSNSAEDTPTGQPTGMKTPTVPLSPRPSTLPITHNQSKKNPKTSPYKRSTSKDGSVTPNFDHIQSSYKIEKSNPHYDRSKFVKVPTMEDKIVRSSPILEGLLPKHFYDQKLSFDLESVSTPDSHQSTPESQRRSRSKSEVTPTAPTTGHLLWSLMKERKLQRAEDDNVITDLDLAVGLLALTLHVSISFKFNYSIVDQLLKHVITDKIHCLFSYFSLQG